MGLRGGANREEQGGKGAKTKGLAGGLSLPRIKSMIEPYECRPI